MPKKKTTLSETELSDKLIATIYETLEYCCGITWLFIALVRTVHKHMPIPTILGLQKAASLESLLVPPVNTRRIPLILRHYQGNSLVYVDILIQVYHFVNVWLGKWRVAQTFWTGDHHRLRQWPSQSPENGQMMIHMRESKLSGRQQMSRIVIKKLYTHTKSHK